MMARIKASAKRHPRATALIEKDLQKRKKAQQARDRLSMQRRPRRFRPGTVALREIRRYQASTNYLINRAPFQRLVRQICQDLNHTKEMRFQASAINAIQSAAEDHLIKVFEDSVQCMLHAGRKTLMTKDMQLAKRIRGDHWDR